MAGHEHGIGLERSAGSVSVNGIKPCPPSCSATADWQGMKISAEATTAVPFVIYNGTSEQMVKAGPKTSFHLMVMLNDAQTGVRDPLRERVGDDHARPARSSTTSGSGR